MSPPFPGKDRPWPPLITNGSLSRWVRARDIVLTIVMWLLFVLLIAGEVERLVAPWLVRLGIPINVRGIGYNDLGGNWHYFLRALAPFLGIALILVIALVTFAIDTLNQRSKALRGPAPPPLPLVVEARHAELATIAGHKGQETEARRAELAQIETVDARAMLGILRKLDQAALTDARNLQVTQVHVTDTGHYQILPEDEPGPERRDR